MSRLKSNRSLTKDEDNFKSVPWDAIKLFDDTYDEMRSLVRPLFAVSGHILPIFTQKSASVVVIINSRCNEI